MKLCKIIIKQNKKLKTASNKTTLENCEEEIKNYKEEINQLNQVVKTYEEHNKKICDVEKKIRIIKAKHEKEIKDIEAYYKDKIVYLTKKEKQKKPYNLSYSLSREKSSNTIENKELNKKQVRKILTFRFAILIIKFFFYYIKIYNKFLE